MKKPLDLKNAVKFINEHGILLVFPMANRPEPLSIWSCFFPKTRMLWEWDETADGKVVQMWHLRERLSRSDRVVYSKWFSGRATFLSREVFVALLNGLHHGNPAFPQLSGRARLLLDRLLEDSPQSSKTLKKWAKKECKWEEQEFERALKELWARLLIVGRGEVDDGAFPSLNIGATQLMFEDLWQQAHGSDEKSHIVLERFLPPTSLWRKNFDRVKGTARGSQSTPRKHVLYYHELIS
ncbi:MAG: hypothetical protein HY537_02565 [Deltaproteobacteria bacterium]|nr:hypothetical protein [Deltaproteobacteria bacterium]